MKNEELGMGIPFLMLHSPFFIPRSSFFILHSASPEETR